MLAISKIHLNSLISRYRTIIVMSTAIMVSFLISCSTIYIMDIEALDHMEKGMTQKYVKKKISVGPKYNYSPNDTIEALIYQRNYYIPSGYGQTVGYDFLIFAFKDSSLFYWGSLDDFQRSDDINIRELGIKTGIFIKSKI